MPKLRTCLALLLLLLAVSPGGPAGGADYHVSAAGDDASDGTAPELLAAVQRLGGRRAGQGLTGGVTGWRYGDPYLARLPGGLSSPC